MAPHLASTLKPNSDVFDGVEHACTRGRVMTTCTPRGGSPCPAARFTKGGEQDGVRVASETSPCVPRRRPASGESEAEVVD